MAEVAPWQMRVPAFSRQWRPLFLSASIYEALRNYLGLMPLRENCSKHCWMSADASTEWKSYSRPRSNYVAWLPGTTPYAIFRSTTVGTRSLFVSANQQCEMSIQVQKSALRLRTSKSLTSDVLNASLGSASPSAMTQWTVSACECADCKTSAKICLLWSACSSGKRRSIVDKVISI